MLDNRVPEKIVIFYDKQNEAFLIRLIDENWTDIFKYDTLPAFCKLSDFYVDVIKVNEYKVVENTTDSQIIILNDKYIFSKINEGKVEIKLKSESETTSNLKDLFGVAV